MGARVPPTQRLNMSGETLMEVKKESSKAYNNETICRGQNVMVVGGYIHLCTVEALGAIGVRLFELNVMCTHISSQQSKLGNIWVDQGCLF